MDLNQEGDSQKATQKAANNIAPADAAEPFFLTLFVACYNEQENICATLDTVISALTDFDFTWEIIVIDDASADGSPDIIEDYRQKHPDLPIRLYVNKLNKGLAQNYIEGAFLGRGKWYRLICGDNVEPRETFTAIFKRIGEADMIIPYQVECKGRSFFRQILSGAYTGIINFLSGYKIRYYNGLAVHLRYNVMRWHTNYRGFGFQADMITRLIDAGMTYIEIPVTASERTAGKSTALTLKNQLSVAHTVADLLIRRIGKLVYGK